MISELLKLFFFECQSQKPGPGGLPISGPPTPTSVTFTCWAPSRKTPICLEQDCQSEGPHHQLLHQVAQGAGQAGLGQVQALTFFFMPCYFFFEFCP